jgi:hypothetical protein
VEVGDLGSWQDKGGGTVREILCDDVRSDEAGESGSQGSASEKLCECLLTTMTVQQVELNTDDPEELYEFLVHAEVVEDPLGFREIVAELWPKLLHKVKPPLSQMY